MINMTRKKTIGVVGVLLAAFGLMAYKIVGYVDMPLMSTPGNPASGYLRYWPDSTAGKFKCLTSAGAACYFDAGSTASHTLGYGFGYTGGGNLPAVGYSQVEVTFSCTISGSWYLKTDGTATIDVLVAGSSITGGSAPTGTGNTSGSTSGWTTSISGPTEVKWNLSSVSGATFATLSFGCN